MTTSEKIISAHPVAGCYRAAIQSSLGNIEKDFDVKILFACESGSRGWGFASEDSDYDVRFIYVHKPKWYVSVDTPSVKDTVTGILRRDVIEQPISGLLDINGWDLRKALFLLRKSNPTLLEWLDSPIVYRNHELPMQTLRSLVGKYYSPAASHHHYITMARSNFREHLNGADINYKKYLYVLRPLLANLWVCEGRVGPPPMRFAALAEAVVTDEKLLDAINHLVKIKMAAGESMRGPRIDVIHAFIISELDKAPAFPDPDRPTESQDLDDFLYETAFNYRP